MKKGVSTLIVIIVICDIILISVCTYYYNLERWATGSIYLFLAFTSTIFSAMAVIERRDKNKYAGNEVEIMINDFHRYSPETKAEDILGDLTSRSMRRIDGEVDNKDNTSGGESQGGI